MHSIFALTGTSITMKKICLLVGSICIVCVAKTQQILPAISVANLNGNIVVSWRNEYKVSLANINVQRSYDSLRNYTTIGSVLNPQNRENGYADANPPYNKMYYRLFIAFEGGKYIITEPVRPTKDTAGASNTAQLRYPWQLDPNADPNLVVPPGADSATINFPSKWIYTAIDNNLVLHLPDAAIKRYRVVFTNEQGIKLFELNNLKEEYLIIEKVNFVKSGWYNFDLYESGHLIEKNHFFIPKDGRVTNDPQKRSNNR